MGGILPRVEALTNSQIHPQGWISLLIAPEHEARAKQMRAERDRLYRNIYSEAATDKRWVAYSGPSWAPILMHRGRSF